MSILKTNRRVTAGSDLSVMRIAGHNPGKNKKEVIKMTRENRLELLKKIGERMKLERSKKVAKAMKTC